MSDERQSVCDKIAELAGHFSYLDRLRESGRTNMWQAPSYLVAQRGLDEDEAKIVFGHWQDTFDGETPPPERAERAVTS